MSDVEFPPAERVNLFGDFTRGELVGAAVATALFGVGVDDRCAGAGAGGDGADRACGRSRRRVVTRSD